MENGHKKSKDMYMWYQNLWTVFVANNNMIKEYDDVALVRYWKDQEQILAKCPMGG